MFLSDLRVNIEILYFILILVGCLNATDVYAVEIVSIESFIGFI